MSQTTTTADEEIQQLLRDVRDAKKRLKEARLRRPQEDVSDYTFTDWEGKPIKLSELFGDKQDLILVHNMGTFCVYCTMWADGFTGMVPHLNNRAAFVVISNDKPEVQKKFAEKRHWNFRMVSAHANSFNKDMGMQPDDGPWPGPQPGITTFKKGDDGKIYRAGRASFEPGDDFCPIWHFMDLLEGGAKGWEPEYAY